MAGRVSQNITQVLIHSDDAKARVSQNAAQILAYWPLVSVAYAKVTQVVVQVLVHTDDANVRSSQVAIQVLAGVSLPTPGTTNVYGADFEELTGGIYAGVVDYADGTDGIYLSGAGLE